MLRGAVNAAATRRNAVDIQLHNRTAGEQRRKYLLGGPIRLWIAKLQDKHRAVADVKVDVAGRCDPSWRLPASHDNSIASTDANK